MINAVNTFHSTFAKSTQQERERELRYYTITDSIMFMQWFLRNLAKPASKQLYRFSVCDFETLHDK